MVSFFQSRSFVYRNVVSLIALDFVQWIAHRSVVRIFLVIDVSCVHLDDLAVDVPALRVPGRMIADLKFMSHSASRTKVRLARQRPPYRPWMVADR